MRTRDSQRVKKAGAKVVDDFLARTFLDDGLYHKGGHTVVAEMRTRFINDFFREEAGNPVIVFRRGGYVIANFARRVGGMSACHG